MYRKIISILLMSILIIPVGALKLEGKRKYKDNCTECAEDYNNLLDLEEECHNKYFECQRAIKENMQVNEDLLKALNNQKKKSRRSKIKTGLVVGGITFGVAFTFGLGVGLYIWQKSK